MSQDHPQVSTTPHATSLHVPGVRLLSVQHPGRISNVANGVQSLGGDVTLDRVVTAQSAQRSLSLRLSLDDPPSQAITAKRRESDDILLRVRVPKRIGKRKRGSNEPFPACPPASGSKHQELSADVLRSLKDNVNSYEATVIGKVTEQHSFRTLPDFYFNTNGIDIVKNIKKNLMPFEYDKTWRFRLGSSRTKGAGSSAVPPPRFARQDEPLHWAFCSGSSGELVKDSEA